MTYNEKNAIIITVLLRVGGFMRKRISNKEKPEKSMLPLKRILAILLIFFILMGMIGVMASNERLISVKIVLSSGYEMNVMTTNKKVSDILAENHIIVLESETVTPEVDQELSDNKTITITKGKADTQLAEESYFSAEEIIQSYTSIVEKIVTVQEEIPYETITKDVSNGNTQTQNRVTQIGVNGLKEVVYRIKYQNGEEIEKTEVSSKIIREPVDKIVEVRTITVTSRSSAVYVGEGRWTYSEEDLDLLCAITAQECSSSYEGALAVITTACNRTQSSKWRYNVTDPLSQYKARGQFCYSIDSHWKKRLNGNYASYVKQAVLDALNGKRNHRYLSFRSAGYASGVNIGGNVYFNEM